MTEQQRQGAEQHADQRLQELFARHGTDTVCTAMVALHERAEQQMRAALATLPQGFYQGEDWLDDDAAGGPPLHAKC
mgnify:CR=1 FL=1